MKTKIILTTLLCITVLTVTRAQNAITTLTANYQYPQLNQIQLAGMNAIQLQMEQIKLSATVGVDNTQQISKLVVLIGTVEGSSDISYKEYDYGVEGTFADGTSYTASGSNVLLGIGTYSGVEHYYVEVAAIMQDGSQSTGMRAAIQ